MESFTLGETSRRNKSSTVQVSSHSAFQHLWLAINFQPFGPSQWRELRRYRKSIGSVRMIVIPSTSLLTERAVECLSSVCIDIRAINMIRKHAGTLEPTHKGSA